MGSKSAFARWLGPSLFGAIVVVGCSKSDQRRVDTPAAAQSAGAAAPDTSRIAVAIDSGGLVQLVSKYTFKTARRPVHTQKSLVTAKNKGVKLVDNPSGIDIATANAGPILGVKIVAKVTSDKPYHGLGLGKGDNYIVLLMDGSKRRYFVYSITPYHKTELTSTTYEYSSGPASEPRLVYNEFESSPSPQPMTNDMVAYAFCFEDDLCTPTRHCGYNNF